jgi:predicted nucleotidyltransferase
MRLADEEQLVISNTIHQADADALIYLFGSRTDDEAQGGDIDLLVLSKKINLMAKLDILAQLHQKLGERKIDMVIYPDTTRPFPRMVLQTGVPL